MSKGERKEIRSNVMHVHVLYMHLGAVEQTTVGSSVDHPAEGMQ